eukprot:scaffold97_cov261-Pinguiococcus_pyrenoidosus.AAC.3
MSYRGILCLLLASVGASVCSSEDVSAAHNFPRILHLVCFRWSGRFLDPVAHLSSQEEQSLGKWRQMQTDGWTVRTWTALELQNLAADHTDSLVEQESTLEQMRNVVLMLAREGGVVVLNPFESAPVRPFEVIWSKLTAHTDFFAGMVHPGVPAQQVEECVDGGMRLSQAVAACGSYVPVSVNVMGYAPSDAGTLHRVLQTRWAFRTSPAEEILAEFDGSQVLFNWRYFQVPKDLQGSFREAVVSLDQSPLPADRHAEDVAMASKASQSGKCTGDEAWARSIPRLVHQVWISNKGSKPMPSSIVPLLQDMRMQHEALGWEYKFWGNELFDIYADEIPLDLYRNDERVPAAVVSDHFRLLLLRDYGGVVLDADAKALRTFEGLLSRLSAVNVTFFAGSNFPKPGRRGRLGGNMVGLRGGPPLAFVAMGASNCSAVVDGLLKAGLPDGRWYWPSQVEARSEVGCRRFGDPWPLSQLRHCL